MLWPSNFDLAFLVTALDLTKLPGLGYTKTSPCSVIRRCLYCSTSKFLFGCLAPVLLDIQRGESTSSSQAAWQPAPEREGHAANVTLQLLLCLVPCTLTVRSPERSMSIQSPMLSLP
jgi:hypothetical protein